MPPIKLELRRVTVRYGTGPSALVAADEVDLAVPTGTTVGLVGESGCGKSTLARAIVGLAAIATGEVLLDGVDYTEPEKRNSRAFRRRVQMVFQDPYSSLNPRITVGEMLMETLSVRGTRRSAIRSESLRLLDIVGLASTALDRFPHQFSGGQRQRIAIARSLAVAPEVIIHDEVTSSLDVSVQGTILNLLRGIQRELHLSYIFISHDLSTVRYMSDSVSVMYLGRIVESASTDELFASPGHPYTRAMIDSVPRLGGIRPKAPLSGDLPDPRHPPVGCRFHTRCPVGPLVQPERTLCLERDPQLDAPERFHRSACHFVQNGPSLSRIADSPILASAVT